MVIPSTPMPPPNPLPSKELKEKGEKEGQSKLPLPVAVPLGPSSSYELPPIAPISSKNPTVKAINQSFKEILLAAVPEEVDGKEAVFLLSKAIEGYTNPDDAWPLQIIRAKIVKEQWSNLDESDRPLEQTFGQIINNSKVIKHNMPKEKMNLALVNEIEYINQVFEGIQIITSAPFDSEGDWKEFPEKWQSLLFRGVYHIAFAGADPNMIKRYFEGAVARMHRMFNELAADSDLDTALGLASTLEDVFVKIHDEVDIQKAERMIKEVMDLAFLAPDGNKGDVLSSCLEMLQLSIFDNESAEAAIKTFSSLKKMYLEKKELATAFLDLMTHKGFEQLQKLAKSNESSDNYSMWNVLLRLVDYSDHITSMKPMLLRTLPLELSQEESIDRLNEIYKIAPQLGGQLTAHLVLKYFRTDDSWEPLLKKKQIGFLKEVLEAERKLHIDILSNIDTRSDEKIKVYNGFPERFVEFNKPFFNKNSVANIWSRKQQDIGRYYQVLTLASQNDQALLKFLYDNSVFDSRIAQTNVSKCFTALEKLAQNANADQVVRPLLTLIGNDKASLALELINLKDKDLQGRLLEVVNAGNIALVEFVRSNWDDEDPYIMRLIAQVDAKNATIVKQLINLYQSGRKEMRPFFKMISNEPLNQPFSYIVHSVLSLNAMGEKTLLAEFLKIIAKQSDAQTEIEKNIIRWVGAGYYSLAKDYIEHPNEFFWRDTLKRTNLTMENVQQLRELNRSLKVLKGFSENEKLKIENIAQMLLQGGTQQDKDLFDGWLSIIQLIKPGDQAAIKNLTGMDSWQDFMLIEDAPKPLIYDLYLKDMDDTLTELVNNYKVDKSINFKELSDRLAKILITPTGGINRALIAHLEWHLGQDFKENDSSYNRHILFVLKTLKENHSFNDRLEMLRELPPKGSRQDKMFESLYGANYTVTQIKEGVLSALLYPIRQLQVGSCFGTAVAIQLNSTEDGLKQAFEDFLSLTINGRLIRKDSGGKVAEEYPIIFDGQVFKKDFPNDNLLSRVREFTISSMSASNKDIIINADKTREKWEGILFRQLETLQKHLDFNQNKTVLELQKIVNVKEMIGNALKAHLAVRYMGFIKDPVKNKVGGWVLVDKMSEVPLVSSRKAFESVFLSVFEEIANLDDRLQNGPQKLLWKKLFEEALPEFVKSDRFLTESLGIKDSEVPTFFSFDTDKVTDSALITIQGGFESTVIQKYHNENPPISTKISFSGHPLMDIYQLVKQLSPYDRQQVLNNPNFLKIATVPEHVMNLKLGHLVRLVDQHPDLEDFLDHLQKRNVELLLTPITPILQDKIVNACLLHYPEADQKRLRDAIEASVKKEATKVLEDLCNAILRAVRPPGDIKDEKILRILNFVLSQEPELKDKIPPFIGLFDTNWALGSTLGLSFDLSGTFKEVILKNESDAKLPFQSTPLNIAECTILSFQPAIDDVSRSYCHF